MLGFYVRIFQYISLVTGSLMIRVSLLGGKVTDWPEAVEIIRQHYCPGLYGNSITTAYCTRKNTVNVRKYP